MNDIEFLFRGRLGVSRHERREGKREAAHGRGGEFVVRRSHGVS
jgi:hypothetical protein